MAITWRNVDAPSTAGVAQGMQSAAGSVNDAFGIFNKLLQQRESFDANEVAKGHEANKQAFLDALSQAKTPEEMAQLQASGNLDVLKARLNPAGMAAVRGADEARLTAVRTNASAATAFENQQRQQREAPIREAALALVAQGKTGEARALLDTNTLSVESDIYGKASTEDQAATARKQAEQDRTRLVNVVRPREDAAATDAAALRKIQMTAAQQAAADTEETRRLETRLAQEASANSEQQATVGKLHSIVAKAANIDVVNALGLPDFSRMSADQIKLFDASAKAMGMPQSGIATGGDTARGDKLFKSLSGQFSARVLSANEQAIRGAVRSTTPPIVGNDAATARLLQAKADVIQKEEDARNRFAPGSADAQTAYDKLAEVIKTELPENAKEDAPALQKMLAKFATKGLEIRPGVFVTPSAQDILGEIRGYDKWNFLNKSQADDIEANLKETLKDADVTELLKNAERSRLANRNRALRSLLDAVPETPKK